MTLLSLEDVDAYYGKSHVLHEVSFDIDEHETVALLGRNGAGKTTTIRTIQGMLTPRAGAVRFKGESIVGKEPFEISRTGIATVPETKRVFASLTVEDNISTVARGTTWSLERLYDIFPRLAERSNQRADTLSGGEQQMLAIARALSTGPDLLLLDEPSEGLAPLIVERLRDTLRDSIQEELTILLTEQNVEFALDFADRVVIIEKGQIKWIGSVAEFEADESITEEYLTV